MDLLVCLHEDKESNIELFEICIRFSLDYRLFGKNNKVENLMKEFDSKV